MAKNREMLKEAIAEAKAVKEMAIANAKAALEEAFTPQLKSMISLKLQEMEEDLEEGGYDEEYEDPVTGKRVTAKDVTETEKDTMEVDLEELLAELEDVEEGEEKELQEAKDEEEDEIPVESQGNELEEFSQEFDLDDYDDIFPHDELSTNVEGEEGGTEDSDSLSARKEEFYKALDAKIYEQSKNNNSHAHIICDNVFEEIYSLMLSLQGAEEQERLKLLRKIPNKVGYKWEKKYDILTVDTSHILIFKQENGEALDSCKKVVSYGRIFDVLRQIHELDAGNDHPKAKTLFKRVTAKYGKSIPRWACEMFPRFCQKN